MLSTLLPTTVRAAKPAHHFCLPTVSPIPRPPVAPTPRVW
jgi:hypothetical protein